MMVQSNLLFGSFLVKENLIGGIAFGGVMALVMTIMDRYFRKNKSLEKNSTVKQQSTIEMPFSYEKTYQLCKESVMYLHKAKVKEENLEEGFILVRTGINIRTWGEVIKMTVSSIENERTLVTIVSKPFVITTMVDYGKNLENVKIISEYLEPVKV